MRPLPPDDHVHSEFSYDTPATPTMLRTCAQAVEVGLPSVAFTEHLDFTTFLDGDAIVRRVADRSDFRTVSEEPIVPIDVEGYLATIAECRERFPRLRILSGVESGEAHLFAASLDGVLKRHPVDRVLGSVHSVVHEGRLIDANLLFGDVDPHEVMRGYFTEVLALIGGSGAFEILAHADFPRRAWPRPSAGPYRETDFEEEYRAVFRALAGTGRVLEVNTKSALWSAGLVRWWHEAGGDAVSFGSDAHRPSRVGERFARARDVVEAAGFRPGATPLDFWRR